MAREWVFLQETAISVDKTIGELQALLVKSGADQISIKYSGGEPLALRFTMQISEKEAWFQLPVHWRNVYNILGKYGGKAEAQAKRTAWRQVLAWVKAQMAMIQAEQIKAPQAYMPHMVVNGPDGESSMYEIVESGAMNLLPAGSSG